MDRDKHILDNDHIGRLLLKISGPAMVGMAVNALYNVVDAIFVGRGVGTLGIAGIAIVFPIQAFVLAIALMLGIGGASVISRSLGAKNYERANLTVGNAMLCVIFLGLSAAVLGTVFLKPLLAIFGASETIMPYAEEYAGIILIGSVFFAFSAASNNFIRAEGRALIAMTSMLMGAVLNIILDPIFIFGFHLGIRGAAIATVISQISTSIFLIAYFRFGKSSLKIGLRYFKLKLSLLKEIVAVGSASFVRQLSFSILSAILNNILKIYGGDVSIAVYGILNRMNAFAFMPMLGIAQGVQPIVGFNHGARRYDRLLRTLNLGIKSSSAVAIGGFLILYLFPGAVISIFTRDQLLISRGIHAMRYFVLALPMAGFHIIAASMFQAVGKARQALTLTIARQVSITLMVIILPRFLYLDGIWMSFPLTEILFFFLTLSMYLPQLKEFNHAHLQTTIPGVIV